MTSLFVKRVDGRVTTLHMALNPADVNCTLTVGDLKRMVQEAEGIPAEKQTLVFAGKKLADDLRTNDMDVGLQKESTLYLLVAA
mmetsp:Transcript_42658/g.132755  ORF Transcript_42658/g.132755 Transcript_42658/m.132755 type:complete len:84 (+) Transcript_42658:107-358(+)